MSWWPFSNKKEETRDYVRLYLNQFKFKTPGIRTISQLNFVVLDTETTGLDYKNDHILSFGCVKISGEKILIHTSLELYPESDKSSGKSAEIHGLIKRQQTISQLDFAKKILPYLGNAILVGQHVGFDIKMLEKILEIKELPNPRIDTASLALRLEKGPQAKWNQVIPDNYSLDKLCNRYGIATEDRHTASGDAFLTAQLFLKLLKIGQKKGILTYQDLMKSY